MKFRLVKCPICGRTIKTYAKWFFRCCGRGFSIEKCLTDYDSKVFRSGREVYINPNLLEKHKKNNGKIEVEIEE